MAEWEGFEPPVPFRVRRFSRPEPSTTRPPLRLFARQMRLGRLVSLQQAPVISVRRQKTEGTRMEFHYFGKVGKKVVEAVVPRIGMIFMLNPFLLQFVM